MLDISCSSPRRSRARSSGSSTRPRRRCSTAPSCSCCRTAPPTRASGHGSTRTSRCRRSTRALREYRVAKDEENLRRRTSIVLRSGAIRNVHDVCMALGLGADGVCPYVMIEVICVDDYESDISNICSALRKGIEKVHLDARHPRGARLRTPVLVDRAEARAGGDLRAQRLLRLAEGGHRLRRAGHRGRRRQRILAGQEEDKPAKTFRFYPKVYKAAIAAANGTSTFEEYSVKVRELEHQQPISMRHILDLQSDREPIDASQVDAGRGPPLLSDRDLLDVVRLAGRDGFPRLSRGSQAGQHHVRQRRGRRDPRHVRQVPACGAASRSPPAASA